ncbi:MAG: acetylxylan esterase [Salinispira sp.]
MPLTFDFSLEELHTYTGTNPVPDDFNAFWDNALQELTACDPQITFKDAAFTSTIARCRHLSFSGVGGARIHTKLIQPHKSTHGSALLCFHGYTMDSGDWMSYLPYAAAGFTVAAMDCRGQGGLSTDPLSVTGTTLHGHIIRGLSDAVAGYPERLYYRNVFLDTVLLSRIIMDMPDVDTERVMATGWSQGGGLTIACAALEPRISRIAPVYPYLCDYQRSWEMDLAEHAYSGLRKYFRHHDPLHEQKVFEALGYIDVQYLAGRVRAQTLFATALMDTICAPSTQFACYNKIHSSKNMLVYPDYGHESLPGLHDRIYEFFTKC